MTATGSQPGQAVLAPAAAAAPGPSRRGSPSAPPVWQRPSGRTRGQCSAVTTAPTGRTGTQWSRGTGRTRRRPRAPGSPSPHG
eukprot:110176-Heterocapsa_arctica.AAC.1